MTAYGRATTETEVGLFVVEVLSVNRKHLDIQVNLPKVLSCLEVDVRKWVSKAVKRGQVTVRITPRFNNDSPVKVFPNLQAARRLHEAWQTIADDLGIDEKFSLRMLKDEPGVLTHEDDIENIETYREAVERSLRAALEPMLKMKEVEGSHLEEDFLMRLDSLEGMIGEIETRSEGAPTKFREKLKASMQEVLGGSSELDDRVLQEVCIYAEKVDTNEEITRFKSHIIKMRETIKGESAAVGKTLEFLLQEMGREVNTIGSKSSDLEVAHLVVAIKTELERIREQVQNVE